ncbi:hypothetical protein NPIL_309131 [Nephila pilipes]|uniref:Uncharacterized protein n=1 Tax=Nephila pilipes TaxID=299642 RepID=A0A8X6TEK2_NEPPI|nr:hypothetical protein NPIL_309131 [Nephila pilipes]
MIQLRMRFVIGAVRLLPEQSARRRDAGGGGAEISGPEGEKDSTFSPSSARGEPTKGVKVGFSNGKIFVSCLGSKGFFSNCLKRRKKKRSEECRTEFLENVKRLNQSRKTLSFNFFYPQMGIFEDNFFPF